MNALRFTKGIVLDDRCYPPSVASQLFNYLPQRKEGKGGLLGLLADADMIKFEDGSMQKKTTYMLTEVVTPVERKWFYKGKIVVLLNEYTQSAAEGLASHLIEASATSIGSHTAGANGDITNFNLPGVVNLSFSGHKPFNSDGTTMQRVGIIPKIKVLQTINGFREGKDEVLERGIRFVVNGK
jgi:C-terminal processing protease CtpA/Prc